MLRQRYFRVRARTEALCATLTAEDQVVQSMPDASPVKWHLGHTSWFFETFVLGARPGYRPIDDSYQYLFNSYYEAVGDRQPRARRGQLTRPGLDEVRLYRKRVDDRVASVLGELGPDQISVLEVGLHHEQQHQELILTDVKHLLGTQPLRPGYRGDGEHVPPRPAPPLGWRKYRAGIVWIGADADGFAFDNERPRHQVLVAPFQLASRPVTAGEVLAFIAAGGYRDPAYWLSDGWARVQSEGWQAPLYWEQRDDGWLLYDLAGMRPVDPAEPACHLSYYEADAYARFAGARLPTEAEWEIAAVAEPPLDEGNFADDGRLHPRVAPQGDGLAQIFGDVWEWTASAYAPYPGFQPLGGALGEYNGKFMCSQMVLRGGSCFTPRGHVRPSYRNFFPPEARWQMTGVRLAKGV